MALKGLKIQINSNGVGAILAESVVGIGCNHQNALVIITTMEGSDQAFPKKGTKLLMQGLQNAIFDNASAQHSANFAALSAVSFCRKTTSPLHRDIGISGIRLIPRVIRVQYLQFQAIMTFANGEKITSVHNVTST